MLYKPFRADRLMEAVEQALRTAPAPAAGPAGAPRTAAPTGAPTAPDGRPARRPRRPGRCPPVDAGGFPTLRGLAVMNLDWPWLAVVVLVGARGMGHLCHLVLAVNVVSGLGHARR